MMLCVNLFLMTDSFAVVFNFTLLNNKISWMYLATLSSVGPQTQYYCAFLGDF